MVTALLTAFVTWSMFVGSWQAPWPLALGLGLGFAFFVFARHGHGDVLRIDVLARRSRFFACNPRIKLWGSIALLVLCVMAKSPWPPLLLFAAVAALTVAGGIPLRDYLALLALPAVFLLLGSLALLWNDTAAATGLYNVPFGKGYLALLPAAQANVRLIVARALGAVGCLYFLSLSTPMPEILSALRSARVPAIVIELAVLMYRYIFILFSTYRNLRDAAASRLGYVGLRRSLITTGRVYSGLLARSFRRAGACFDAMESRCYTGEIRFLVPDKPVRAQDVAVLAALLCGMALAVGATG